MPQTRGRVALRTEPGVPAFPSEVGAEEVTSEGEDGGEDLVAPTMEEAT